MMHSLRAWSSVQTTTVECWSRASSEDGLQQAPYLNAAATDTGLPSTHRPRMERPRSHAGSHGCAQQLERLYACLSLACMGGIEGDYHPRSAQTRPKVLPRKTRYLSRFVFPMTTAEGRGTSRNVQASATATRSYPHYACSSCRIEATGTVVP